MHGLGAFGAAALSLRRPDHLRNIGRQFACERRVVALPATRTPYPGANQERRCKMRRADRERLEAIFDTVQKEPGIKAGRVAQEMGLPRSSVTRALPALEEEGLLLSQDGRGRLFPWSRKD